ncbi:MAG: UvrD-helicase domain-containing protein [Adlercreutzia equolifaciens]
MTDMMAEIAAFDGRTAKIVGPARSGKTEALLRRAAAAVAAGCAPEDILIETSTAEAARVARRRLVDALAAAGVQDVEDIAGRITVACAQQVCLAVLETPEARAATGRTPRVLAPFEYNFFLEDMKTLGTPARRLRSELGHIKKQWCALAPEDTLGGRRTCWSWPSPARCHERHAGRRGGLPRATCKVMRARARQRFALVLADDFQNFPQLSRPACACSPRPAHRRRNPTRPCASPRVSRPPRVSPPSTPCAGT